METKTGITMLQIREMLQASPDAREDARVRVLIDLVNEYEHYTHKLEWLTENLTQEVAKNQTRGMASVHETVLSTSLIPDITRHAAKIAALVRVLETTCKAADDPTATVVDTLIRTLDWRARSEA